MMAKCRIVFASAVLTGASAHAQLNTFDIRVSNTITPDQPSATVEVWAVFDPQYYAFAHAAFDRSATADPGGFSNPERMLDAPESSDGVVDPTGDRVVGIVVRQLHFPGHLLADSSNPILAWRVTWSTSDFTPRSIDLGTATSVFDLYINKAGVLDHYIDQFTEGSGVIHVVPTPSAAAALLAFATVLSRRRRLIGGL
jgi:hypothetical protein